MYTAAGKKIANEGGKDITMVTGSNKVVQTNWQTVDITRPLSNVRQNCLQGNRVLFGAQIQLQYWKRRRDSVRHEDNVYVLDLWVLDLWLPPNATRCF